MFKLVVLLSVVAMAAAKPGLLAPLTYNAVVPGVSSLSQYSSSVVHGSPAVYGSPVVYGTPTVYSGVYNSPVVSSALVAPGVAALSQAPNSPAVVLDAVNGVPLDTPEVVAARVAHYQAKALSGVHHLHKRSLVAPVQYSSVVSPLAYSGYPAYSTPLVSAYSAPVVTSPLGYSTLYPKAYSVHPY